MIGYRIWQIAGWTMLHYLWVGAVLGAASVAVRYGLRSAAANIRYLAALGSLLLMTAAPAVIAAVVVRELGPVPKDVAPPRALPKSVAANGEKRPQAFPPGIDLAHSAPAAAETMPVAAPPPSTLQRADVVLNAAVLYLPWLWIVGAPLALLLTTVGMVGAERLRRQSRPVEDAAIAELCRRLAASLRISHRVAVAVCDRIAAPVLLGIVRPMVLLPAAAVTGWSPQQLEMVLLHELYHVRRWDNLVNLLQRIAESVLFFHPMIWAVSAWVRCEREHCCDAAVIEHTRQPHAYAQLLFALAERASCSPLAKLPLAAPQVVSSMAQRPLVARIRRILKKEEQPMQVSPKILALVLAGFAGVTLAIGGYCSQASRAEDAPPAAKSSDSATKPAETPWGKPAEGIVARVRTDKTVWTTIDVPEFQVDVKNLGKTTGYVFRYQGGCEVEIDGVAYYCSGVFYGEHVDFPPGQEYLSIPVGLAKVWYSVKGRDPRAIMKSEPNGANAKISYLANDRDTKGTPLRLSPGKHTLRAVYIVDLDKDPVKGRSIRAVSNTIEFEVQKPVAGQQPGGAQVFVPSLGWGQPTEGISARVHAEKTVWAADEAPVFQVDVKNLGQITGHFFKDEGDCELRIDDVAYYLMVQRSMEQLDFPPGRNCLDIPIKLGDPWHPVKDRDTPTKGAPLALAPGKHTLQVVYIVELDETPRTGRTIRAVSNTIEFEVQPAAAAKRAETPWGKPTQGFVARVRADKTVSPADWVPGFRVDIKNSGRISGRFIPEEFELQIDGLTYHWGGAMKLYDPPELRPGQESLGIPIMLDNLWHKNDGTPLTLSPGKHTLQVVCKDISPPLGQTIHVVSNTVEFEVPPVAVPKPAEAPWGKPTEGISTRLRTDKALWPEGQVPTFQVDIKNSGNTMGFFTPQEDCELEIDDVACRWLGRRNVGLPNDFPPGKEHSGIPIRLNEPWRTAEDNAALAPVPGRHTLRVVYLVHVRETPGTGRSIRAVSNTVVFEIQSPDAAKLAVVPWGKPTEGISARVCAEKTVWPAGQLPVFLVGVENSGKTTGYIYHSEVECELEIDGVVYYWYGAYSLDRIEFRPGQEFLPLHVTLGNAWRPVKDRDAPSHGTPLTLAPGKHSLRVIYVVDRDRIPRPGQAIRAVSNDLEFEVQPASATKAGDPSDKTSAAKPSKSPQGISPEMEWQVR